MFKSTVITSKYTWPWPRVRREEPDGLFDNPTFIYASRGGSFKEHEIPTMKFKTHAWGGLGKTLTLDHLGASVYSTRPYHGEDTYFLGSKENELPYFCHVPKTSVPFTSSLINALNIGEALGCLSMVLIDENNYYAGSIGPIAEGIAMNSRDFVHMEVNLRINIAFRLIEALEAIHVKNIAYGNLKMNSFRLQKETGRYYFKEARLINPWRIDIDDIELEGGARFSMARDIRHLCQMLKKILSYSDYAAGLHQFTGVLESMELRGQNMSAVKERFVGVMLKYFPAMAEHMLASPAKEITPAPSFLEVMESISLEVKPKPDESKPFWSYKSSSYAKEEWWKEDALEEEEEVQPQPSDSVKIAKELGRPISVEMVAIRRKAVPISAPTPVTSVVIQAHLLPQPLKPDCGSCDI